MTEPIVETKNIGLRGIPVADTKISAVNGEKGSLIYRGFDIRDLARFSSFEEVVYLLLNSELPNQKKLRDFSTTLASRRMLPDSIMTYLRTRSKSPSCMDVLQSVVPYLADFDEDLGNDSREANLERGLRLIAWLPTIVAAWSRLRNGLEPVSPSDNLGHAANFLFMLHGKRPDPETARDFDVCLILHADHSFNASTFAAREVASTRAHMYACVAAALGSLSGQLHGGANQEVMEMLLEIKDLEKVETWVSSRLDAGGRIMGMGHAVYKTEDPRALILREISRELSERTGERKWFELTQKTEKISKEEIMKRKKREIYANVDLYTPSIYYVMGIPPHLFTPVFAISRIAGWVAHIVEEKFAEAQPKPVLYRPEAEYIGRYCGSEGCAYIPLEKRQY